MGLLLRRERVLDRQRGERATIRMRNTSINYDNLPSTPRDDMLTEESLFNA